MIYILLLTVLFTFTNAGSIGIKAGISQSTILKTQIKFLPGVFELLQKKGFIADMKSDTPTSSLTARGYGYELKNAQLKFEDFDPTAIKISFEGNDVIVLKVTKLKAELKASVSGYYSAMKWSEKLQVKIDNSKKDFSIELKLRLDWQESSSKDKKGKKVMKVTPIKCTADFQLAFTFSSATLSTIQKVFDLSGFISGFAEKKIKESMDASILPLMVTQLEKLVDMPTYVEVLKIKNNTSAIFLDYSLLSKPKIIDGNVLVMDINGRVVQKGDPNDVKHFPLDSNKLPSLGKVDKGFKLLVSEYTLNTALHAFYYSSLLLYRMETGDLLAKEGPLEEEKDDSLLTKIRGSLNPTNLIRANVIKSYGPSPKLTIEVAPIKLPQINLVAGVFTTESTVNLAISSFKYVGGKYTKDLECFAAFEFTAEVVAIGSVAEGGKINLKIEKLGLKGDFKTLVNKVRIMGAGFFNLTKITDKLVLKKLANYGLNKVKKSLNDKYKDGYKHKLPTIQDVIVEDSSARLEQDYVAFEYGVRFAAKAAKNPSKKTTKTPIKKSK